MNLLDWTFIVIIGVSILYGLFKGFVKEVTSILAIILGFVLACRIYGKLSATFKEFGLGEGISNIFSFVILFLVISFVVILIGKLIHRLIKGIHLGWLNRLAGMSFGFIRGIVVSGILVVILVVALSEKSPILAQSKLSPYIIRISRGLVSLVPENLKDRFLEHEKRLKKFWEREDPSSRSTFTNLPIRTGEFQPVRWKPSLSLKSAVPI